jgi:hypothetical protein
MQVQRLSPAAQTTIAAGLERGVAAALKDIRAIQGRMTEELRVEDAITNVSVKGGKVVVEIDGRFNYKPEGVKHAVAEHLAKHGIKNVSISTAKAVDVEGAIAAANTELNKIQNRNTRDLRAEDDIVNLSAQGGKDVSVVLKARPHFDEATILKAAKKLLGDAGLKDAKIQFVRPAILPIRPIRSFVDDAMAAIKEVQGRAATDVRAEDDIVNLSMGGHGGTSPGEVRVVLRARPHFSEAEIKKVVTKHLEKAGMSGFDISFIRPRILPMRPPVVDTGAPTSGANKMKAKVDVLAADIRTVQSRMTEEIRIEDAIKTIKVVGAKVVVTLNQMSATTPEGAVDFIKDEMKKRGITLPLVVK